MAMLLPCPSCRVNASASLKVPVRPDAVFLGRAARCKRSDLIEIDFQLMYNNNAAEVVGSQALSVSIAERWQASGRRWWWWIIVASPRPDGAHSKELCELWNPFWKATCDWISYGWIRLFLPQESLTLGDYKRYQIKPAGRLAFGDVPGTTWGYYCQRCC